MPKRPDGKKILLLTLRVLMEKSDEKHRFSANDLIQVAEDNDYTIERKAVYKNIKVLQEMGFDILYNREAPAGWYMASRDFELPELKLLVDAVQCSKFITAKKSEELIGKLEKLASVEEAKQLHRQLYATDQVKTDNELVFYNVDGIQEAMARNLQITYQYYQWNLDKELEAKNGGEDYLISPWALTWDNENYYMIGYDAKAEILKHYRVDKMKNLKITGEERQGRSKFENLDLDGFARRTFGMFGGKPQFVTLKCENSLIGVMLDRFGKDAIIVPSDEGHFRITVEVTVSGQFYGWLVGLGPGVRILDPISVSDEFKERIRSMFG